MTINFKCFIIFNVNIDNIGGSYVTAKRNLIIEIYQNHSNDFKIPLHINNSCLSPDNTTLFTTSGMQHFKKQYSDTTFKDTFSNIQKCLRLNDLDEIGDGTHFLNFEMIGLFSFREKSLKFSIDFMISFLKKLNLKPDYVTIHPDKINEWKDLYKDYDFYIKEDSECIWSDGNIGGYCTEFYIDDIEIGNIVNTLGDCIDIGFGLERLLQVSNSLESKTKLQILEETSIQLISEGVNIGHCKQEYILKKLIIESIFLGSKIKNEQFDKIRFNLKKSYENYLKNKDKKKFINKSDEFWLDTFGFYKNKENYYRNIRDD